MSNSKPSTLRRHSQSETNIAINNLVSAPYFSKQSRASEDSSERSMQVPVMTTRPAKNDHPTSSGSEISFSSTPSRNTITSSSSTVTKSRSEPEKKLGDVQVHSFRSTKQAPESDSRWGKFLKAMTADGQLTVRDIRGNELSDLVAWLRTSPTSLRKLAVEGLSMRSSDMVLLSEALKINTSITELSVRDNRIGTAGAKALAEALRFNATITELNVRDNQIDIEGTKALAEALKFNKAVTKLDLSRNQMGAEGAKVLAEALRINANITKLDVSENLIGKEGAKALAYALKFNKTVANLNVNHNRIEKEGAKAMADALKDNKTITELCLDANNIGEEGAKALAEALRVNKTLKKLSFYLNKIGVGGATALADALKDNKTIIALYLSNNDIGAEGAIALANALKDNKNITDLYLDNNEIGADGVKALFNALKFNKTLTSLELRIFSYKSAFEQNDIKEIRRKIDDLLEKNREREKNLPDGNASIKLLVQENSVLAPSPMIANSPLIDAAIATKATESNVPAALIKQTVLAPSSTPAQSTSAATINALLAAPSPDVALVRWIDGHTNPAATLNWVDPVNGYTLLHYAVEAQQIAVIRSLLIRGIDRKKQDHTNQTASQLAHARANSSSSGVAAAIAALLQ